MTTTYSYNGHGLRTSSSTMGGVTTTEVDDVAQGLPVRLVVNSHLYVYGPEGLAYVTDSSGSTLEGVVHTDGLGSVRALSDSSGSVVQVRATDAWGMVTQRQGSVSQPFGYTGRGPGSEWAGGPAGADGPPRTEPGPRARPPSDVLGSALCPSVRA